MKIEKLNKMNYDDVMSIVGAVSGNYMTLKNYAEGGWFDSFFGKTQDFNFLDGGLITIDHRLYNDDDDDYDYIAKIIDDDDDYDYIAKIIDEDGNEERFSLMF